MKTIQLLRRSVKLLSGSPSYALDCEITSSQGITKNVFVKLRMKNADQSVQDVFYSVASPMLLETLSENAPAEGSRLFRTNKMRMINTDLARLEADFLSLTGELQQLCDSAEILDELQPDSVYSISATEIETNMAVVHTHYRIPLTARPCGVNEVYTDNADGQQKHRITSVNTAQFGWIPVVDGDPVGTFFKYNLATDTSLAAIWPIKAELLTYAHIEINGVTSGQVLVNGTNIYWKTNRYGSVPWPKSYVNPNELGDTSDAVTLVLDCIA